MAQLNSILVLVTVLTGDGGGTEGTRKHLQKDGGEV